MRHKCAGTEKKKVLMLASVASMIDQFNMPNIRLLQEMGYEVHVACNYKEGNTCDERRLRELQKLLRQMHVVQHPWDCPRKICPIGRCIRAYRQLRRLTDRYEYDWIHCHSPIGGVLTRLAAHKKKIRIIYTAHGFHFYRGAPWKNWMLYFPVEKLLSRWTDVLLTINKEDYLFAKAHFHAGSIRYLPGIGIDTGRFRDYRPKMSKEEFGRKYRIPKDAKILLSVGELSVRKNHRLVISLLPKLDDSVYYLICGQGAQQKRLVQLALRRGVFERVRFLGYQEDVREFYAHADIFVLPSLQEGLPAALMEAMACGLPCIVSDIRGNRELAGRASCLLPGGMRMGRRQILKFQETVRKLLESESYRQSCIRQNLENMPGYDWSVVKKRMQSIYMQMDDS